MKHKITVENGLITKGIFVDEANEVEFDEFFIINRGPYEKFKTSVYITEVSNIDTFDEFMNEKITKEHGGD
jgi:hypothetical protein